VRTHAKTLLLTAVALVSALMCAGHARAAGPAPHYELDVKLLPDAHRLEASGTVRLPAADGERAELKLTLNDVMRDFVVEVVEPSASAGRARVEKKGRSWVVTPPRAIPAGAAVVLRFSYSGGERGAVVFYLGPEGTFASGINTAWYPQAEGGRGTGTLRFDVPAGYKVHAAGARRTSAEEEARGRFRFDIESPVYFAFGAGRYTVRRSTRGRIPVSAHLLRPRASVDEYLDGCSKVLDVLVKEFGPYPHAEFALVEVPNEQAEKAGFAGASVDGFIYANSFFLDQEFNLAYYGHEIGHQWWGNLIRAEGDSGLYMLSEGLSQYGSVRVVEEIEGAEAAARYRRRRYPGYAFNQGGAGYLQLAAAGFDSRLDELPRKPLSHLLANSKGFIVLDMLSREVGRERFRRAVGGFVRRHAGGRVTWAQFRRAVEAEARRDLGWFFRQWVEGTGAPVWELEWTQGRGRLRGRVTQRPAHFRAPAVELLIEGAGGEKLSRRISIAGARTEFDWPLKFTARAVVLDPLFEVLHYTPETFAEASALAPYTRADRLIADEKYYQARAHLKAALAGAPREDAHGLRFMLEYGLARVARARKEWKTARAHFEAALAAPVKRAELLPIIYLRLADVARSLRDKELMRRALDAAVAADAATGDRVATTEARQMLTEVEGLPPPGEDELAGHPKRPPPSLKGDTTFRLKGYADASTVAVFGSFNDWNREQYFCARDGDSWVCRLDLAPGKYTYGFVVDGELMADPANPETEEVRGERASVIVVKAK
jgi:hypothetical protein